MSITSTASSPIMTGGDSPDTLPLIKYTVDQLANYIQRQLGYPVWNVELTRQQILDQIQDGLQHYSIWCPLIRVGNVVLVKGQFRYLEGVNVDQGIAKIEFVEPNPVPTEIFYGNLINPAPLFRLGLDEYDTFLRWRKTWMRVTSVKPDWFYDDTERVLFIHNPIERYQAGIFVYSNWVNTTGLPQQGAVWVKEYALEKARYLQGDVWLKYSGAIPGPVKDIQLDAQKRDKAGERIKELIEQLKGMQTTVGISIDAILTMLVPWYMLFKLCYFMSTC